MTTPKKEYPYDTEPRLVKIKNNLIENFGYEKVEARHMAHEIIDNMRKYDILEKLREDSIRKQRELSDNRTLEAARPKTILEQRMERQRGNLRIQVRER